MCTFSMKSFRNHIRWTTRNCSMIKIQIACLHFKYFQLLTLNICNWLMIINLSMTILREFSQWIKSNLFANSFQTFSIHFTSEVNLKENPLLPKFSTISSLISITLSKKCIVEINEMISLRKTFGFKSKPSPKTP